MTGPFTKPNSTASSLTRLRAGSFWVRWVIENAPTHVEIDEWQNTRGTEVNTLLWYREEYLVVLAQRAGYWLLRTAYCTEKSGRIAQLRRERDAFRRATP